MFENESNFIIQFAKSIEEGRGFLRIYQTRILSRFVEHVETIDRLISANARATEVNIKAEKLRIDIERGRISTQKEMASYADRMNERSVSLIQRHLPMLLYLFLYASLFLLAMQYPAA
ncbi:MAG: hypothetical protein LBD21_10685 [Tannerellaceae bacterium]|jgi:hypothetical protein|nr:hypothetical protein [Tannerellaceae bacterium]